MADTEKQVKEQQHSLRNAQNKNEPQGSSPYDEVTSEKTEDEAGKMSEGSMRDYIVSAQRGQARLLGPSH